MKHYEVHITVEGGLLHAPAFREFCKNELEAKAILIKLDGGAYPMQLMLAKTTQLPNDPIAAIWGASLAQLLIKREWGVRRLKVEAPLHKEPGDQVAYYEAHWKFDKIVSPMGFLYSRNLLDPDVHYLSLRYHEDNVAAARKHFDDAHARLLARGLRPVSGHYERVVLDGNPELDKGWGTL